MSLTPPSPPSPSPYPPRGQGIECYRVEGGKEGEVCKLGEYYTLNYLISPNPQSRTEGCATDYDAAQLRLIPNHPAPSLRPSTGNR
jgi:hypothetical protein